MFLYFVMRKTIGFWRLYKQIHSKDIGTMQVKILLLFYNYYLTVQGGYIGVTADLKGPPDFPHGQKGVFISGGATIGSNCTIYQNVTIGSNRNKYSNKFGAPCIGNNVLIGAGATIIGRVKIGDNVRIAANAAINEDVPDNAYVFPQRCKVLIRKDENN